MELWELSPARRAATRWRSTRHSGDRYMLEDFAGAFCEDGVLEIRGADPLQGRDAIMARFGGAPAATQAQEEACRSNARPADRAASCATT